MKILRFIFGAPGQSMTEKEREISDSIKKLKTLKVVDGRVSIDASEVFAARRSTSRVEEACS